MKIKIFLNGLLGSFGYTITRADPYQFIRSFGLEFNHVIDVGVADGTPDLWNKLNSKTTLHLIDPLMNVQTLSKALNKLPVQYLFYEVALSSKSGLAFNITNNGRASKLTDGAQNDNTIPIISKSLDDLGMQIETSSDKRINLLKVDVEGHELNVLEGATETLAVTDIVIVEIGALFHQNRIIPELLQLMEDANFQIISCLDAPKNSFGVPGTFDILFVKKHSQCLQSIWTMFEALRS